MAGLLRALICLLLLAGFAGAGDYYVYVACESEDEVDVVRFDGESAVVVKRIPVGVWPVEIEGPHGITISPDGKHWFLSMAHGKPNGILYKYTTGDDEFVADLELGLFPATMQISPATGFLYIVNFNLHGNPEPSTVSVVDPVSMTEIERIETGIMPHGSRISPDGLAHYSVAMMSDELFEIDALALSINRSLHVGTAETASKNAVAMKDSGPGGLPHHAKYKPTWVFPHPAEPFVYVANNGAAEVVEVDTEAWEITRRFPTGKGPYNVEVSADGRFLVATYKSEGNTGVWDLRAGEELAVVPNSRKVSHGVVISPDSRYAFVSVEGIGGEPGAVDVIDLKALERVATADVGKQAGGIAFWKIEE